MLDQAESRGDEHRVGGIQVIARAAAVMRALGEHPKGLSLAAIAQLVNLPRSTVQRIVGALEVEELVQAVGPGGGFRLGPELHRLIHLTQIDIISAVRPLLEELSATLNESVVLCGLQRGQVFVVDHIVVERELRVVPTTGAIHLPVYSTAPGKALLSAMSADEAELLLIDVPSRDRVSLLAELRDIRSSGVAEDYGEHLEGVASFAVSVSTYLGRGAVSVVMPVPRAAKSAEAVAEALLECKQSIERKIGG